MIRTSRGWVRFMQVVFKPRLPMGIFVSDVQGGRVSGVLDGQAKEQGLEPSGLQSEFQDWISFQFFSTFSSTSQHGAVVCVSRVDQRHFVMVSIDGQPYSSLPQQERNNNDSIVPPSGPPSSDQANLTAKFCCTSDTYAKQMFPSHCPQQHCRRPQQRPEPPGPLPRSRRCLSP